MSRPPVQHLDMCPATEDAAPDARCLGEVACCLRHTQRCACGKVRCPAQVPAHRLCSTAGLAAMMARSTGLSRCQPSVGPRRSTQKITVCRQAGRRAGGTRSR